MTVRLYRTKDLVSVLLALDVVQWRFGARLCEVTGLSPAQVSKNLERLRRAGLVMSRWEEKAEARAEIGGFSRPRRRFFRLTAEGMAMAAMERARLTVTAVSVKPRKRRPSRVQARRRR